jgi:hypothetical protein
MVFPFAQFAKHRIIHLRKRLDAVGSHSAELSTRATRRSLHAQCVGGKHDGMQFSNAFVFMACVKAVIPSRPR